MQKANWDDIRYVLAVANSGSISAASRDLGVNHATVLRRIQAFELASGGPVFERGAQGYRLRTDRAAVIEAARDAAQAMESIQRLMTGGDPAPGTVLRLTSVDSLCQTILADGFARIAAQIAPHRVALVSSNQHLDMARMQADVTVRPSHELPEHMIGDKACNMGFAVYEAEDAPNDHWLGMCGPLAQLNVARWCDETLKPDQIVGRADSFLVLAQLVTRGQGRAFLPFFLAKRTPGVRRAMGDFPVMDIPVWVACHRDVEASRRIAVLRRVVLSVLQGAEAQIRG